MCFVCPPRYPLIPESLSLRFSDVSYQIEQEIDAIFGFLNAVYGLFGFEFHLELSTRPEKFLGRIETWDEAERVSLFQASGFSVFIRTMLHATLAILPATPEYPGAIPAGEMGVESRGWGLLRAEDRYHNQGCAEALASVRDNPTGLPVA